jgi:DNA-binding winged helix-turn-helix (wHTH) protein
MFPTGARFAYSFGPFLFEVDAATARLFRGRERLPLSAPQSAILLQLIANAGHVVSKDALAEAGWKNVAVTTNSVTQSVLRLRKVLEATPSPNSKPSATPATGRSCRRRRVRRGARSRLC